MKGSINEGLLPMGNGFSATSTRTGGTNNLQHKKKSKPHKHGGLFAFVWERTRKKGKMNFGPLKNEGKGGIGSLNSATE